MAVPNFYGPVGSAGLVTSVEDGQLIGTSDRVVRVANGGWLTTNDLAPGDAGDAAELGVMTAEFWFRVNSSWPASSYVLCAGPNPATGSRQWAFYVESSGGLSFAVQGESTAPTLSGPTLQLDRWYYVVGTITPDVNPDDLFVRLYVNGIEAATPVAWADTIRAGYSAGSADIRIGDSGVTISSVDFCELGFYRVGLSSSRILAHYRAGAILGLRSQTSGPRIATVLDAVSSRAPRRLSAGSRTLPEVFTGDGASPLDEIDRAVSSEAVATAFFTDAEGTLVFLDADHRSSSPYDTVQATFGDADGELAYLDLTIDYSDSFLTNEWSVTREGSEKQPGETQVVSDATSIARYGRRPHTLTGLAVTDDTTAADIANALLANYKDPMTRISSLTLSTEDANVAEAIFRRELMDKIRVLRTPPGGGARIQQDLYIQKIEISGANDGAPWSVKWSVSPL